MDTKKRELEPSFGFAWLGLRRSLTDKHAKGLEERVRFKRELEEVERQDQEKRLQELAKQLEYLKREYQSKEDYVEELIAQKLKLLDKEGFKPDMNSGPRKPKMRMGDLMVAEGLVTQAQLEEAMEHQKKFGGRLGDIVSEMGFVDKRRVSDLLDGKTQKGRLGDMLVNTGAIKQEELNQALEFQRKSGGMLGDILMAMRFIEPEKLYRHIATQNNLGRIGSEFDFHDLNKLPEYLARQYDAVVISQDLNRYLVAVGGPLSDEAQRAIEALLELPIEQVLATREEMEYFWKQIYESELMVESTQKLVNEQPENSAHVTFTTAQLVTAAGAALLLVVCFALDWFRTLIAVNVLVQVFYFSMTLFKFLIVMYGTRDYAQIRFTKEQVDAVDERTLPIYTILVPMYKESKVIPYLLGNIERLDYPKAKLDVRLLIEEDDVEAQELLMSMNLPAYYTTIVVPHSLPKTKPKACNYGLIRARGEYVVIYDAEDRPDSDQLKKVHAAFVNGPANLACIQGKLNYFNSDQNLLTRWFTHEYSMWFELLLPGVMQLNIPIPLGGTSNHFKMAVLKEINAWDPYNVTEDADLGIRLYKSGYTTAIVDSRTWEEANSRVGNWIRQRSRWIKGYMQTWLVHMRNPFKLYKELGLKGFMGFQVMVLATPLLPLLNPFYWLMIILWYGWQLEWIPQIFPGAIYYFASVEFLVGNFLFVFSNVVGVYWVIYELEKRKEHVFSYGLVKYALLTPFYWVLMSIAAVKAAWQLITKPFYWEKTTHGLSKHEPVSDSANP
ncbi:glycosyltransferase family 2 protein [Paenibacillus radicis (ex Xue et al. 2023)]|uniref:Glycosyltransferase n=1 Tax=Paenibacillus radicis (ex Xue et al. 2023) TaxID=2972489 RepID=A0ABT1YHC5_9BACL|nr:glycosyltransferase family 2 protein [Paenibacillus radicis (ex Xue et al. 2023)]MCR8632576.1 glycosyltransferase [Paenibacillus radicis (ex Xue et al. 2023)]